MNVLAIGAHPDDIEMGCFATLAKHYFDGDKIFAVLMTNGELGGDVRVRRMEQEAAAKEIDMELYFGNFPDGDVRENAAIVTFLDNIIKKNEIDVVYTHSEKDRHQDHRAIARASISASRTVNELYCYEDLSLVSSFNPQLFVDVTDTFHVKKSALKKYESQIDRVFIDGLETKILRVDYAFRGVIIPKGNHEVTFTYDPNSFKIGLMLALSGIIGTGGVAGYLWKIKFRS